MDKYSRYLLQYQRKTPSVTRTLGQYSYIYILLSDPFTRPCVLRTAKNSIYLVAGGDSWPYNVEDHFGNACNNIYRGIVVLYKYYIPLEFIHNIYTYYIIIYYSITYNITMQTTRVKFIVKMI